MAIDPVRYTVSDAALLPTDAVSVTDVIADPTFRLPNGDLVVVDGNASQDYPGLPNFTVGNSRLIGQDAAGDPVYVILDANLPTELVSVPTLDHSAVTADQPTTSVPTNVPAGFEKVGVDPLLGAAGVGTIIYQNASNPAEIFIPGYSPTPGGSSAQPSNGGATVSTASPQAVAPGSPSENNAATSTPLSGGTTALGPYNLAAGQQIWLAPVDPLVSQSLVPLGGLDFSTFISSATSWPTIGKSVNVLSIYGYFFEAATDQQIRNLLAFVKANNLQLAVQNGAVSVQPGGIGYGVEGFCFPTDPHTIAERISSLGGRIDYFVMDEPLWFTRALGISAQTAAASAASNIQQVLAYFPHVQIGDQEPIGGLTQPTDYQNFQNIWTSITGNPLSFVQLDVQWSSSLWQTDLAAFNKVAAAYNQQVGVIFDGHGEDSTQAEWAKHALDNSLIVSSNQALRPTQAIFQSWNSVPTEIGQPYGTDTLTAIASQYLTTKAPTDLVTPAPIGMVNAQQSPDTMVTHVDGAATKTFYDARGYYDTVTWSTAGTFVSATTNEPFFDPTYYEKQYGVSLGLEEDPLANYESTGWKLGRNPSAVFNNNFYVSQAGSSLIVNPLADYEDRGWKAGLSINAAIDPDFYNYNYLQIATSGLNPTTHYLQYGYIEGRNPGPLIDSAYYFNQKGAGQSSSNPVIDYETSGWKLGLNPIALFDTNYYLAAHPEVATSGMDPLTHYLTVGWKLNWSPTPWFDPAYYLAHNPDVASSGVNPLIHYLELGWKEGRDPSAQFSSSEYLKIYADVAAAGMDPLLHYIGGGKAEGRVAFAAQPHDTVDPNSVQIYGSALIPATTVAVAVQPFSSVLITSPLSGTFASIAVNLTVNGQPSSTSLGTLTGTGVQQIGTNQFVISDAFGTAQEELRNAVYIPPALAFDANALTVGFHLAVTDGNTVQDSGPSLEVVPGPPPSPTIDALPEIAPTDHLMVSGTASYTAGTVSIYDSATLVGSVSVQSSGNWSTSVDLVDGTHTLTAYVTDANGQTSQASSSQTIVLDTPPAAPVIEGLPVATRNATQAVTGASVAGDVVTVFEDGNAILSATCSADGTFTSSILLSSEGLHLITVTATDQHGYTSAVSNAEPITLKTTAPVTPTIQGAGGLTNNANQLLAGSGEAGDQITLSDNGLPLGTTTVSANGSWTAQVQLSSGANDIVVASQDLAGNKSGSSSLSYVYSNAMPSAPYLLTTSHAASARTDQLAGRGDAGDTVSVYNNNALVATAIVTSSGQWTSNIDLNQGANTITIDQKNAYRSVSSGRNSIDISLTETSQTTTDGHSLSLAVDLAQCIATVSTTGNLVLSDATQSFAINKDVTRVTFLDGTVNEGDQTNAIRVDPLFYYANNHDVWNAGIDASTHYDLFGWKEGRNPSASFDTKSYLSRNRDVAASGMDPLHHYQSFGKNEGRVASLSVQAQQDPAVDWNYYYSQDPAAKASGLDADVAFDMRGWQAGKDPDPWFDVSYYLKQNPDVASSGLNPLQHYEQFGWKEGRNPSLAFDTEKYLHTYTDVAASGQNPLMHMIQYGQLEGRVAFLSGETAPADPLIDTDFYDRQLGATIIPTGPLAAQQAASSFETIGWTKGENPNSYFDVNYYLAKNQDVAAAHIDPLIHYETFGWKEGRNPSASFDTDKYIANNKDVAAAAVNPLLQYITVGVNEHRAIFAVN